MAVSLEFPSIVGKHAEFSRVYLRGSVVCPPLNVLCDFRFGKMGGLISWPLRLEPGKNSRAKKRTVHSVNLSSNKSRRKIQAILIHLFIGRRWTDEFDLRLDRFDEIIVDVHPGYHGNKQRSLTARMLPRSG